MCYYPRLIMNSKYKANKKNGGIIPPLKDERVMAVPIGCGECMECRKKKAREWQIRLSEEIKHSRNGIFVTLTFSNEAFTKWKSKTDKIGYDADNEVAKMAVRNFLENWRKKYKKSVRHWLTTELGGNGTENVHLHGIIFTDINPQEIRRIWKNGYVWLGNEKSDGTIENYVNLKTINYIIKYVSKSDEKHKGYKSKIMTSAGIGRGYMKRGDVEKNKYKEGEETNESYRLESGHRSALPIYYRNKIYSEEEREKLWLEKLDKQIRWVGKNKIDVSKGYEMYNKAIAEARAINNRLGYGGEKIKQQDWEYEQQRRILLHEKRDPTHKGVGLRSEELPLKKEVYNEGMEQIKWGGSATDKWD